MNLCQPSLGLVLIIVLIITIVAVGIYNIYFRSFTASTTINDIKTENYLD